MLLKKWIHFYTHYLSSKLSDPLLHKCRYIVICVRYNIFYLTFNGIIFRLFNFMLSISCDSTILEIRLKLLYFGIFKLNVFLEIIIF
jgi:hypothetical protein